MSDSESNININTVIDQLAKLSENFNKSFNMINQKLENFDKRIEQNENKNKIEEHSQKEVHDDNNAEPEINPVNDENQLSNELFEDVNESNTKTQNLSERVRSTTTISEEVTIEKFYFDKKKIEKIDMIRKAISKVDKIDHFRILEEEINDIINEDNYAEIYPLVLREVSRKINKKFDPYLYDVIWTGEDRTDINDLYKIFTEKIVVPNISKEFSKLKSLKLGKNQTVYDFALVVRSTAYKAGIASKEQIVDHFINGLPRSIQGDVRKIASVYEGDLDKHARVADNVLKTFNERQRNKSKSDKSKPRNKKERTDYSDVKCYYCKEFGHYKSSCPKLEEKKSKKEGSNVNRIYSLVDTGAEVSVISGKMVEDHNMPTIGCRKKITGIGGTSYVLNKKLNLDDDIYVFDDLEKNEIIIGQNLINKYNPDNLKERIDEASEKIKKLVLDKLNVKEKIGSNYVLKINEEKIIDNVEENTLLAKNEKEKLIKLLIKYKHLFIKEEFPDTVITEYECKIPVCDNKPVKQKVYKLPIIMKDKLKNRLEELLKLNIIRKSNSAYGAPIFMIPKKNNEYRLVVDYRELNKKIIDDPFMMKDHQDIFSKLYGSKYFSSLDFAAGYYQVKIADEDVHKTAFVTEFGTYEFLVMPFGLKNAPAVFQRFTEELLNDNINAVGKLDDIIVYSQSFQDHLLELEKLLERIDKRNAKLKYTKCNFAVDNLEHLGLEVDTNGLTITNKKIDGIRNIDTPKNSKELKSVVQLFNVYREFIPKFAQICAPLYELLRKDVKFNWTKTHQDAFEHIKQKFIEKPILIHPDMNDYFYVETDASKRGLGCVVMQKRNDIMKPVAYYSRRTTSVEKNKSAFELEAAALRFAAEKTKYYTQDNPKVIVQTDHKNLKYIKDFKNKNAKMARTWFDIMNTFNRAQFNYIKGKDNIIADSLSRLAYVGKIDIKALQAEDTEIKKLLKKKDYDIKNEIVGYRGKPYIPEKARLELLYEAHEDNGHLGINGVISQLCQRVHWPGIYKDIRNWIQSCKVCQLKKISRVKKHESNIPHMIGYTWKRLHLDFVGPVEKTMNGNEYILTIIDAFSKYAFAFAVKNADAKTVIEKLEKIFLFIGIPEEIYTDNGKHFTAEVVDDICKIFNLKHYCTSSYNPQANGICERFNATLSDTIATVVDNNIKDWDMYVDLAVSVYNRSKQKTIGICPYEVIFGVNPRLMLDVMINNTSNDVTMSNFIKEKYERMEKNEKLIKKRLEDKAKNTKVTSDVKFNVNDKVLLKIYKRGNANSRKKFTDRYSGPFVIKDITSGVATLTLEGGKVYGKWKLDNLKKYYEEKEEEKNFRQNRKKNEKFENEEFYESEDDEYEDEEEKKNKNCGNKENMVRRSKREKKKARHEGMIDLSWLELDDYFY